MFGVFLANSRQFVQRSSYTGIFLFHQLGYNLNLKYRSLKNINPANMTTTTSNRKYTIDFIKPEDTPEVMKNLKTYFWTEEPLNKFLNLGDCPDLEVFCYYCIDLGFSVKAVDSQGEIIGVLLSYLVKRDDRSQFQTEHKAFKIIINFIEYVEENFNFFDLYRGCTTAIDGNLLSVDPAWRGCGIGVALIEKTIEYTRDNGYDLCYVQCSSVFTANICRKLKFDEIYELPYKDYIVDGQNPILPEEPHKSFVIFVKKV